MIRMLGIAIVVATGAITGACHSPTSAMAPSDVAAKRASQEAASSELGRTKSTSFRAFTELAGIQCIDPEAGKGCTSGNVDNGDFQTVELKPRCDHAGTFGRITRDAEVMNRTPPNDTTELAKLEHGAKVCVQAIAREGQTDGYYYVVLAECRSTDNTSDQKCVSGWVDAASVSIAPE